MKTKIFASIFLLLLTCCASLKEKQDSSPTTMDSLMKYKWVNIKFDFPKNLYYNVYSKKTVLDHLEFKNGIHEEKRRYYLYDELIRNFDKTQIGKHKKGKYIIAGFYISEILELNDRLLKTRNIETNVVWEFKAVPFKLNTRDLLRKYEWVWQNDSNGYRICRDYIQSFSKNSCHIRPKNGNDFNMSYPYYLSNKPDKRFRKLHISGKHDKYLIEQIDGKSPVVSEILEINDTCMRIYNVETNNVIVFKALPK